MNRTAIEWVVNQDGSRGFTWNPWVGCKRGCSYCYARRLVETRLAHIYPNGFAPTFYPERLVEVRRKKPSTIFVVDMGDMFGPWVDWDATKAIFGAMADNPQHTYLVLTKGPEYIPDPFGGEWRLPPRLWMGVTIDKPGTEWRAFALSQRIPDGVHLFVSYEPLLGPVDARELEDGWIDWIIIGGMTKPAMGPKFEWVANILDSAFKANIPIFCKDNLIAWYSGIAEYRNLPYLKAERD